MGREPFLGVFPPYYLYTMLIIFIMALIFYWLIHNARKKETAIDILKKRYAKVEIDKETFGSMKKELE